MFTTRVGRMLTVMAMMLMASGCAMQAPRYQPSIDNVEALKKTPASVALGTFTVQAGVGGPISLRANSMTSPVGADYAAYLADALQQELTLAGKLDPKSKIEISGVLVKNDIAAAGMSTNSGEVEARIVVKNNGTQRFDKVKRAELSWDSSFVGAIAIPKAQQQYPMIVQKLLAQLWGDADFQAALK
jgi:hypothetical protein